MVSVDPECAGISYQRIDMESIWEIDSYLSDVVRMGAGLGTT